MGYSQAEARSARAPVITGDIQVAANLSSTNTVVTVEMTSPCKQISVQGTGTLAFTWSVSLNGTNWVSVGSGDTSTISNYSDSNATDVQITWVSGAGSVSIVGS